MNDSELKARLAQAEVHFSHYRWDDAIATFEVVLAARPDHPAATQGWASAVEQKSIDEELGQALVKVRESLVGHRFDEALALLNHAQSRGALSHILKYHSEIDGLRSEAQEGQEWQRRIEAAAREAEALAGRRRFEQALEVLDNTLRPLNGRGWERLGAGLAALRERLLGERNVSERILFAQSAYDRQDYRLAAELAANLHEELPERDDVSRPVAALHERARGAWGRVRDQVAAVEAALAEERTDDALALLGSLRSEHPHNPDWQAIALRVHMDEGRAGLAKGRAAMVEHEFEDAAEAFEAARSSFMSTSEIFPDHPTAGLEQAEAEALRDAALSASQAVRDRAAHRWQASHQGWQASRERLSRATGVRGRDFGEVAAVVGGMLGEAQKMLGDLEHARLMLAEAREARESRDAGRARDAYRSGLGRIEGGPWDDAPEANELKEQLAAGLREAERGQREVKKLLGQAEAARTGSERLALLRRAYERWETAPGLAGRLADELVATASARLQAGDEDGALALCEQARDLTGAPAGSLAQAASTAAAIQARREIKAALGKASAAIDDASRGFLPSADSFSQALSVLASAEPSLDAARDLVDDFRALRERAEDGRRRALAAEPLAADAESKSAGADWRGAAEALAAAEHALGSLAGEELAKRVEQLRGWADAVERSLGPAEEALRRLDALYAPAAEGDLAEVDWDAAEQALREARRSLRPSAKLPSPLPQAWLEAGARAEALAKRGRVLAAAQEKIGAGRAVEATPVLQAEAAGGDTVVLAVLSRLLIETADDASAAARGWLAEAARALGQGELATAEAYLALANSYTGAAPQVVPEAKRIERQIASLTQIRNATLEARGHIAAGEMEAALACYRQALELGTDAEAGLPGEARRKLVQLLDLEGEFAPLGQPGESPANTPEGDALLQELLDGPGSQGLVSEFIAPALRRWWKLAGRAAALAEVEALIALGRDRAAVEAAAALVERYPRDRAALVLYEAATRRARERLLGRAVRRLERARRLAARGAYGEALAELDAHVLPPPSDLAAQGISDDGGEIEGLADEAADLRAQLAAAQAVSEPLTAVLEEMREAGLAGRYEDSLALRSRAEFVDPKRLAQRAWDELDALTALVAGRRSEGDAAKRTPGSGRSDVPAPRTPGRTAERPEPAIASEAPHQPQTEDRDQTSEVFETSEVSRWGYQPGISSEASPPPASAVERERDDARTEQMDTAARVPPAVEIPTPEQPPEPPPPFDLEDWLSNVSELGPEDEENGNRS